MSSDTAISRDTDRSTAPENSHMRSCVNSAEKNGMDAAPAASPITLSGALNSALATFSRVMPPGSAAA